LTVPATVEESRRPAEQLRITLGGPGSRGGGGNGSSKLNLCHKYRRKS